MIPAVRRANDADEYFSGELCHILELSNSSGDPGLSIARARVEPGVTTCWHRLRGIDERYLVLEGQGVVELGGCPAQPVRVGDVVLIPAMTPQRISNTGNQDLLFLALCTPRFTPGAYEDLGAGRRPRIPVA